MSNKILFLLVCGMLVMAACQDEETPPPETDQPVREGTVETVISDAWDPYYSPDGEQVVFVEAYRLSVYNLATHQKRAITPDFGSNTACPRAPVWLAGDVVAFVRKDDSSSSYYIWTVPAAGGTPTRYDAEVDANCTLGGDPTGRFVFYTAHDTRLLWRLDLQSGGTLRMTSEHSPGHGLFDPVMKPGVNDLYFIEKAIPYDPAPHAEYVSEVHATGGGVPWVLLNTDKPFLEGLSISPDDKYLLFAHGQGLYALEYRTGAQTWLTRAPSTWLDKDRHPCYAPDGQHFVFTRNNNVCICDAP